jgi:hypothetical protein
MEQEIKLRTYLEYVAEEILANGWVGSQKAKEMDVPSTAAISYSHIVSTLPNIYNPKPSKQAKNLVAETYKWIEENTSKPNMTEYEYTLLLIFKAEILDIDSISYAASAVWCAKCALNRAVKGKLGENVESLYVGRVGEKLEILLRVEAIKPVDGPFGRSYLHRFIDERGNQLSWFSSQGTDMKEDKVYLVSGTVKKQEQFRGVKTTILSRCKYYET